jgi:phytoene synthase
MTSASSSLPDVPRALRSLWSRLRNRADSSFKFAFLFLGAEQRAALEQVYEFCRVVDDIVDERSPGPDGVRDARAGLEFWRDEIARVYDDGRGEPTTDLGRRLVPSARHFSLSKTAFLEIIAGCEMDLERDAYQTREELRQYCYRVASCVGLLCIGIFGDQSEDAREYAVHLGLALQYTNILRDVAEDAARGRVYLPADLLAVHGVSHEDIRACRYDPRYVNAAQAFAALAQQEYEAAARYLARVDDRRKLVPAEIMGRTYRAILDVIAEQGYDMFVRRPQLRRRDKLRLALLSLADANLPDPLRARAARRPA